MTKLKIGDYVVLKTESQMKKEGLQTYSDVTRHSGKKCKILRIDAEALDKYSSEKGYCLEHQ